MKYFDDIYKFIEVNEDELLELWDEYKYEHYVHEYFHPDNVDYFNEDQFQDMCHKIWEQEVDSEC